MAEYIPKLGKAPTEKDERDAIHIAVVPVTAAFDLRPGEHISITMIGGMLLAAPKAKGAGACAVADPFLTKIIVSGTRCWALLYPGTAIGLRHVYKHPALDPSDDRCKHGMFFSGAGACPECGRKSE